MKSAHALALGVREDQRLLAAMAAGLANHPVPSLAQLFLDQPVQFFSVNGC